MDFAQLTSEVIAITNMPHMLAETQQAIRRATVRAHTVDFFPRDLMEVEIIISPADTFAQLDTAAYAPNFRAVAYLKDSASDKMFEKLDPSALLDEYGVAKTDFWYFAGSSINLKSSTPLSGVVLGYYALPDIFPTYVPSWIAANYPYVIIDFAAAAIFKMVGKDEQARYWENEAKIELSLLVQNSLECVAR